MSVYLTGAIIALSIIGIFFGGLGVAKLIDTLKPGWDEKLWKR